MSNQNKISFKGCRLNPMVDEPMISAYPAILTGMSKEMRQAPGLDAMIRFTIMAYDPKSSLVIDERELDRRKSIALDLLFITDPDLRELYTTHKMEQLPEVITFLLQNFIKSMDYARLVALEFKFWEGIQIMMQSVVGMDSKEKSEALARKSLVSKEMDEDAKRIDQLYKQFFMEDADLEKKARQTFTSPEKLLQK